MGERHIVDVLIAERAPRLAASPVWPLLRGPLYALMDFNKGRRMVDEARDLGGREVMDYASRLLHLDIVARGFERIPASGRLVVVINHPTGLADGVAVYDALKAVRPDMMFFANADAVRVIPRFNEIIIPVEWVEAKRTREKTRATLDAAKGALEAERPLIISPAGRIARYARDGFPVDPDWQTSAAALARKHHAPILPLHISGPPATLFRVLRKASRELSDMTLFHELLNKEGRRFTLAAGPLIPVEAIGSDTAAFTQRLKPYIERDLALDCDGSSSDPGSWPFRLSSTSSA